MDAILIAVAVAIFNVVATIVALTWKLSRVEFAIRELIIDERKAVDVELDRIRREFGEVAAALRERIVQFELWARDNFVRRDGYHKVKDELSADIKEQGNEIKALGIELKTRLARMEQKIDDRNGHS